MWCGNGFKIRGYFVYVPEFLNNLSTFEFKQTEEYSRLVRALNESDLVIWDDIASTQLNRQDHINLTSFIDSRIIKGKSNIYTGNLLTDELKQAVGNRLHNRIWDSSEIVKLIGRGRRN